MPDSLDHMLWASFPSVKQNLIYVKLFRPHTFGKINTQGHLQILPKC